jgi:hypothetical protein
MGKIAHAAKPATAPTEKKVVSVKAAAVQNFDDFVTLSWDTTLDQSLIILYGPFGAGKTTTAATVSENFPKGGLPTKKHSGAKPAHVLSDMFWLSFDKGATDGFRERGIAVPEFSVVRFMGDPKLWKKAGFGKAPNIRQAIEFGLNIATAAVAKGAKWVVVDTLTALDSALESYGRSHMPTNNSGDDDTRSMFGAMFYGHKLFHDAVRSLGCGVIYCCHTKDIGDVSKMKPEEKRKLITLVAAGGAELMPALTGKGATVYKGDASLQLAIIAKEIPNKGGLERFAYTIKQQSYEAKNRFELSLEPVERPDLGAMLKKIKG